jgi:hypothetical protein
MNKTIKPREESARKKWWRENVTTIELPMGGKLDLLINIEKAMILESARDEARQKHIENIEKNWLENGYSSGEIEE